MRRCVALSLLLVASSCGPGAVGREVLADTTGDEVPDTDVPDTDVPDTDVPDAIEPAPSTPCDARPPSVATLEPLGQRGVIVDDASAPRELGACISPALVAREGAIECELGGTRCRVGERAILLARVVGEACEPYALIRYEEAPHSRDPEEVLAALVHRDEACALHDRVALQDASLYDAVLRARRITSGAGTALVGECLRDADALALASEARVRFAEAPLRCAGLRCESAAEGTPPEAAPVHALLFANRLSGPLRFDAVAWARSAEDHPHVLELLRTRCR